MGVGTDTGSYPGRGLDKFPGGSEPLRALQRGKFDH